MTRNQARAIIQNLSLIQHFADGGDVGHRMINCHGEQLCIDTVRTICLSNLSPGRHCLYVKAKPRMVWDSAAAAFVRQPRAWPTKIKESEILP